MFNSTSLPEFSRNPPKIKQDDKKFSSSRVVSKHDTTNPSFRVYYGNVSGAIPFTWEIQPGTPKHKLSDNSLIPPLTPPPAYYFSNSHQNKPTKRKYFPKSNLLYNLLFNIKKGRVASSSPSSLSSSSWSSLTSSNVSSSKGSRIKRRRFASFGSSFDDGYMYDGGSPDSVCFGMNSKKNSNNNGGGGATCAVVVMKKAFLSIVGRRSV